MDPSQRSRDSRENELDDELEDLDVHEEDADRVHGGASGCPCEGGEFHGGHKPL